MRQKRKLAENVWYKARTTVNNYEPVFQLGFAVVLFCRVLIEAFFGFGGVGGEKEFPFEMRAGT